MLPVIAVCATLSVLLALASCSLNGDAGGGVGPEPSILSAETYIEAPYDVVWSHFTEPERYEAWSSAPCRKFGPRVGDPVVWGTADRVLYEGELTRIEKGQGLTHTMAFVGFGFEEFATTVDIDIRQQGPTVRISIRHDVTGSPQSEEMIGPDGWLKSLSRLKTLIERGTAMEWPQ